METVMKIKEISGNEIFFYDINVTDKEVVNAIFRNNKIDGLIHFAGFRAVGESIEKPLDYYYNNLLSTIILLKACRTFGVNRFVFSSSATVYGDNKIPFLETLDRLPTTNPYGETKAMSERILTDVSNSNPQLSVSILRYFNPI